MPVLLWLCMSHDVLLLAALLVPVILLTFFRVNAVLVFLSLCLGEVLVHYVAGDANSLLTLFAPKLSVTFLSLLQVAMLLLPVMLTSVFMIGTVRGKGRMLMNLLPTAGVALLGVLLVVPLLPVGQRVGVESDPLWLQLTRLQSLIVGASAIIGLLFLWAQRRRVGGRDRE